MTDRKENTASVAVSIVACAAIGADPEKTSLSSESIGALTAA
jgi:hypothetical protein